jgi:CRP/FNR family transcriptional regulator, cyclic AMP receptor protein
MSGQADVFVGLLRQVHLFSELSEAELKQIAETAVTLRRARNQIIFDEGDSADFLLVLTKGRAKVVLVGDGAEEIILNLIEPFRVVGEIALLDRSTRSARLVALEDCQFIKLPVTSFDTLRNSNRAFAAKIIANVTATLRESNDQLRVICTYRSLGRVAWCLDRLVRRKKINGGSAMLNPCPKHHELAQMTGCSRETVSRALKTLKQKNCIKVGPGDGIQVNAEIARYTKREWPAQRGTDEDSFSSRDTRARGRTPE